MPFTSLRSTSTAIVLFLLGGAALFSLPTSFAASIKTYPGFLSADEVEQFASSIDVDKEGFWYRANKGRNVISLDPAISRRLHDATGTQLTAEEQTQIKSLRSIPVTKITGSTETHVDMHVDSGEPVDGKVAFVFLNDNADVTFVHGPTEVSAKAGTLVVFDGDVPHNTEIAGGTLSLAGPIHLRRLTVVEVYSGPSIAPSDAPSLAPSESLAPSVDPSGEPSDVPSLDPSGVPSLAPSGAPSLAPSVDPSGEPSDVPSLDPSGVPSLAPSGAPSLAPSVDPSDTPTMMTTINMDSKSGKMTATKSGKAGGSAKSAKAPHMSKGNKSSKGGTSISF